MDRNVAYKVFTFEEYGSQERLSVTIPEVLDPRFGMYVWPCAVVLAQYIWTHRQDLMDCTVLELGAGVALPGLVAARCGSRVILSDNSNSPDCLKNCLNSCVANGLEEVVTVGLTWGEVSPDLLQLPPVDLVLGSDVFYEPEDFEDVLLTVAFLLRKNPSAQFWTTFQERSADWSLETLLHRWNLQCFNVPLETFHADSSELAGSQLPGRHNIQMMIIKPMTS
ncbi:methyltransferase-like protein 23 [Synchiropus splendidus]|uniref:methyltransferase-like protein 23 n=1 Tax=Synchiropus splendidus TaxID=270530 RepID=UPI00237E0D23|nr:methyltransferase-like protein 23 [Synchiropus splendidus]